MSESIIPIWNFVKKCWKFHRFVIFQYVFRPGRLKVWGTSTHVWDAFGRFCDGCWNIFGGLLGRLLERVWCIS